MLNRSVPSFFHGKPTSERPFCADCESPMILSRLEPDKPGFDLRTYACLMCAATESIVVVIYDLRAYALALDIGGCDAVCCSCGVHAAEGSGGG